MKLNEYVESYSRDQSFEENFNNEQGLYNFSNADKLSTEKTNHKYFKRKVGDCKQRIIT